jgi:hypothetical protein
MQAPRDWAPTYSVPTPQQTTHAVHQQWSHVLAQNRARQAPTSLAPAGTLAASKMLLGVLGVAVLLYIVHAVRGSVNTSDQTVQAPLPAPLTPRVHVIACVFEATKVNTTLAQLWSRTRRIQRVRITLIAVADNDKLAARLAHAIHNHVRRSAAMYGTVDIPVMQIVVNDMQSLSTDDRMVRVPSDRRAPTWWRVFRHVAATYTRRFAADADAETVVAVLLSHETKLPSDWWSIASDSLRAVMPTQTRDPGEHAFAQNTALAFRFDGTASPEAPCPAPSATDADNDADKDADNDGATTTEFTIYTQLTLQGWCSAALFEGSRWAEHQPALWPDSAPQPNCVMAAAAALQPGAPKAMAVQWRPAVATTAQSTV